MNSDFQFFYGFHLFFFFANEALLFISSTLSHSKRPLIMVLSAFWDLLIEIAEFFLISLFVFLSLPSTTLTVQIFGFLFPFMAYSSILSLVNPILSLRLCNCDFCSRMILVLESYWYIILRSHRIPL